MELEIHRNLLHTDSLQSNSVKECAKKCAICEAINILKNGSTEDKIATMEYMSSYCMKIDDTKLLEFLKKIARSKNGDLAFNAAFSLYVANEKEAERFLKEYAKKGNNVNLLRKAMVTARLVHENHEKTLEYMDWYLSYNVHFVGYKVYVIINSPVPRLFTRYYKNKKRALRSIKKFRRKYNCNIDIVFGNVVFGNFSG